MPNKNYVKGRRKEYKVVNQLRKKGFDIVQRTAGSHSPIDIIAIDTLTNEILFVQCKPTTLSENKKSKILKDNNKLTNQYKCEFIVI